MENLPRSSMPLTCYDTNRISHMQVNMKYAHIEQERRYLLGRHNFPLASLRKLFIRDRYLLNSTLRLRQVDEEGQATVFKLGQKIRIDGKNPLKIAHTTLYLSKDEFNTFAVLPAKGLEKSRSIFPLNELQFAVDVFEGELAGLSLVEVDLNSGGASHNPLPFGDLIEVTRDERFTGGELASTTAMDLRLLLTEYGVN